MSTYKTWAQLRKGDRIVCPTTGRVETVIYSRSGGADPRRSVRTSSHDHRQPPTDLVEIWKESPPMS